MKTLNGQTKLIGDGWLHLHMPCDLPAGDAEVIVVVQPTPPPLQSTPVSDYGVWMGKLPDLDFDGEPNEMMRQWESSLKLAQ